MEGIKNSIKSPDSRVEEGAILALENMPKINAQAKANILATAFEVKPVSEFQTGFVRDEDSLKFKSDVENVLTRLGLVFREFHSINPKNKGVTCFYYFISKSNVLLDKQEEIFEKSSDPQYHELFGQGVGIPESARKAFNNKTTLNSEEMKNLLSDEEAAFSFFVPSKENYSSEMAIVHELAAKIKQVSPALYEKVINESNTIRER